MKTGTGTLTAKKPGAPRSRTHRVSRSPAAGLARAVAHLDSYQRKWFEDAAPMKIAEKSRRIGFDYGDAACTVLDRLTGVSCRNMWYAAHEESAAREYMEYVRFMAKTYGDVSNLIVREEVIDDTGLLKFEVTLPTPRGDARVTGMTGNPTRFRSKGGDVTLSELAWHPHPREMLKAAKPATTLGGRVSVFSSHNGAASVFNLALLGARRILAGEGKPDDVAFSIHRVTIHDAVAQGMVERINRCEGTNFTREGWLAQERAKYTAEEWAEEFECVPSQEADSYFPYDLLRPCVRHDDPKPVGTIDELLALLRTATEPVERKGRGMTRLFAGVDVARTGHRFVLDVIGSIGGMRRTAGTLVWDKTTPDDRRSFPSMQDAIGRVMRFVGSGGQRVSRACIDATGLGMQLGEWAETNFRGRAEAISFTAAVKAELATLGRRHVEERTVTLPDDATCLADFNGIRRTLTAAGKVRFACDENADGHRDFFWARVLSLHAGENASVARIVPVGRGLA